MQMHVRVEYVLKDMQVLLNEYSYLIISISF